MSVEEKGTEAKRPKGVDPDFAFGIVNVLYNCMTAIKEGKMIPREQAVAVAERKTAELEVKAADGKGAEDVIVESEISFKDAFAELKPLPSDAGQEEVIEKERFDGSTVKVLASTFEPGRPEEKEEWRSKLTGREDEIKYLKTGLRYWYSDDWYGSEKRKKPA